MLTDCNFSLECTVLLFNCLDKTHGATHGTTEEGTISYVQRPIEERASIGNQVSDTQWQQCQGQKG
jgi:hypothetical protein